MIAMENRAKAEEAAKPKPVVAVATDMETPEQKAAREKKEEQLQRSF